MPAAGSSTSQTGKLLNSNELVSLALGVFGVIAASVLAFVSSEPEWAFVGGVVVVAFAGLLAARLGRRREAELQSAGRQIAALEQNKRDAEREALLARLESSQRWADVLAHQGLLDELATIRKAIEKQTGS